MKTQSALFLSLTLFLLISNSYELCTDDTTAGCATCNATDNTLCLTCTDTTKYIDLAKTACDTCSNIVSSCFNCTTNADTSETTCLDCNDGYYLSGNTTCTACNTTIENCQTCTDVTHCSACAENYFLNSDSTACQNCSTSISSCSSCSVGSENKASCNACDNGMVVNADKSACQLCNASISSCETCTQNSTTFGVTCTACASGKYPSSDGSKCDTCENLITGCTNCSSGSVCTACSTGFTLNSVTKQCDASASMTIANCTTVSVVSGKAVCTKCDINFGIKGTDTSKCVPCYSDNCETCVLDSSNNPNCSVCSSGYALKDGMCETCSDLSLTNCATCTYANSTATCTQCSTNGFFVSSGACVACSGTGGVANCKTCSAGSSFTCSACNDGYYLNSGACTACPAGCSTCTSATACGSCSSGYVLESDLCVACDDTNCRVCANSSVGVCTTCKTGFYVESGNCSECTQANCASCSAAGADKCTQCDATFLLDGGACAGACTTGCDSCNDTTNCIACTSGKKTLISVSGTTCGDNCGSDQVDIGNSQCKDCSLLFSGCDACNSNNCTNCSISTPYLYEDGSSCGLCNGTYDVPNNTTNSCSLKPVASVSNVSVDSTTRVPTVVVDCGVESYVYFSYGLGDSVKSMSLATIQAATGTKLNKLVATTDTTRNWVGYGARLMASPNVTFQITSILKNSGETYTLNAFCVSYLGGLSSSATGTWVQPSNGAKTSVLAISSSVQLDKTQKVTLGQAVKKVLNVDREMYTDEGDLVPTNTTTRLLQTNTTYTTSFYIVPDYTLSSDNLDAIVSEATNDTTAFVTSVNTALNASGATLNVSGVTVSTVTDEYPTLASTSLTITAASDSFSFNLTISNTDGYVYVGVGSYLNTSNPSATAPSWTQFMNSLDYSGAVFASNYTSYNVTKATAKSIQVTGLSASTNYTVYFAASTSNYPRLNTSVYYQAATTAAGSGGGTTYGEKLMGGLIMIMIVLISLIFI